MTDEQRQRLIDLYNRFRDIAAAALEPMDRGDLIKKKGQQGIACSHPLSQARAGFVRRGRFFYFTG